MPNQIKFNIKKMEELSSSLDSKAFLKIGILGEGNARADGSNAAIGLKHEVGSASENLPKRSFLLMPLIFDFSKKLKKIGSETFKEIMAFDKGLSKIGVLAEESIQEAFSSGGFGKWAPLSPLTIIKKGFGKILVETTQLRKSITSKVER